MYSICYVCLSLCGPAQVVWLMYWQQKYGTFLASQNCGPTGTLANRRDLCLFPQLMITRRGMKGLWIQWD